MCSKARAMAVITICRVRISLLFFSMFSLYWEILTCTGGSAAMYKGLSLYYGLVDYWIAQQS